MPKFTFSAVGFLFSDRLLGGQRYRELHEIMKQALKEESETLHKQWIADLLEYYYDPMYDYQLEKKSELVVFRGDKDEIKEYISVGYGSVFSPLIE